MSTATLSKFDGRKVVLTPTTAAVLRKTKSSPTDPSQITLTADTMAQLLKMASSLLAQRFVSQSTSRSTGPVGTISFGTDRNVLSVAGKKFPLKMRETARRGQEIFVPAPAAGGGYGGPQLQSIGLCLRQYTQLREEIVPPMAKSPATKKAKTVATDKPKKKGRKRKAAASGPSSSTPAKKRRKKAAPTPDVTPSLKPTPKTVADPMQTIHCSKYPEIQAMKEYKTQKEQYDYLNKQYDRVISELHEHKKIMTRKWTSLESAERNGTTGQRQKAQKAVNLYIGSSKDEIEALYGKAKALNIERKFVANRINVYCKACGVHAT